MKTINSITVRRFKNEKERDINLHRRIEEQVFYNAHTRDDEIRWLDEQGPYSEDLLNYIKTNTRNFDYFIFFTFRYCLSYYGIKMAGDKSLIHPFEENDTALNLAIVKEILNEGKDNLQHYLRREKLNYK